MLSHAYKFRLHNVDKRFISRIAKFSTESYSEMQAKKGRPISPHVQIYKFPVAAVSSITNRFTGVALWIGIILKIHIVH